MNAVKGVWEWLGKLLGPLDASMGKWADWGKAAGTAVGEAVASVIGFVGDIGKWFADLPGVNWSALVPEFTWPELPQIDWSKIKKATLATLIAPFKLGAWVVEQFKGFEWPKLPSFTLPELSWPTLPDFHWPKLPQIDWSQVKKATLATLIAPFKLSAWVVEQFKGFEWPGLPEFTLPKINWAEFVNLDGIKAAWGTVSDWLGTAASSLWDLIPDMPSFFGGDEIEDPETLLAAKRAADDLAVQFPILEAASNAVLKAAQDALRGVLALFAGASLETDGARLIQTLADGMLSKLSAIKAAAKQVRLAMVPELPMITAATKAVGPAAGYQGARDRGGPVMAGLPYLVGERGAEIFVPKMAGSIMSHGMLKAAGVASALAGPAALPDMAAAFAEPMQMIQQLAPALGASGSQLPQVERDRTQALIRAIDHRPAARTAAPHKSTTHIDVGGITIVAQPGMDASAIAREVRRELQAIERRRTGDLHDGGEF